MSANTRPPAAVHYYYLLQDDDKDLGRLWSVLTGGPAQEADSQQVSSLPELGLDESPATDRRCKIVQSFEGPRSSCCLCRLADISVIEVSYWNQGGSLEDEWRLAAEAIETDRDRALSGLNGVFGETTLLAAPAGTSLDAIVKAAAADRPAVLETRLDPEATGSGLALLYHFPNMAADGRDYYAIAADDPSSFSTTILPDVDALIKKLSRSAGFFEIQRQTIVRERAEVDHQVGTLLHRQVVSKPGTEPDTADLEDQITNLSRLFGMLATDSLLVRKASDTMSKNIKLLNHLLDSLAGPGGTNEIGAFYVSRHNLDLAEAQAEIGNLDFSRQNTQAAIEVVRTQVEIMRAGEEAAIQKQSKELLSSSLVLQEERLSLQVAAGFIEFVLVFYYVLKSWEGIAGLQPVEHISPAIRLLVVGGFSASAALGTHFLAQAIQRRTPGNAGLWISAAVLVSSLVAMAMLTMANS